MFTERMPLEPEASSIKYAGFLPRLAAFALDYLLIAGYILILSGIGSFLVFGLKSQASLLFAYPELADLIAFLILILPVILYFTLQESSAAQGTWGKRKMGLRVTAIGGLPLSRSRALVRSVGKFLPWQIAHTCLFHIPGWPAAAASVPGWVSAGFGLVWVLVGVYLVCLLVTRTHQTPYDWISGACVVKT